MGAFVKGEVVVFPFPFSDLSNTKRRPALVITDLDGEDIILCAITATRNDRYSIQLNDSDFQTGSLNRESYVRPSKIFTADGNLVIRSTGKISDRKLTEVIDQLKYIVEN